MKVTYFERMCAETGYEPKTTFWEDFSLAELENTDAIASTYNTAFKEWKHNVEYYTELTLVVNWKSWYWHYLGNDEISELYSNYYYELYDWGIENYKDEDLTYFWRTLD